MQPANPSSGSNPCADEDIAIVGMSCMVPRADSPAGFWQNIVEKVDCISDPPPDWQPELFLDTDGNRPDRAYTGRGGYLGDLCRFDPKRYRTMPSSVDGSEPDQFVALRCAIEALEDADVPRIPINREKTGVILGRGTWFNRGYFTLIGHGFYVDQMINVLRQLEPDRSEDELRLIREELKRNLPPANAETVPGQVPTILVGRIANRLDLKGPAYAIDAACASALLAVEQGMRELRLGHCDTILAGGVQVSTPGVIHLLFCHLDALSRRGKITPFSGEADGTLLGQGCGVLVLKRKSDAISDGNRIYALLKGVGTSCDGMGAGLLAPRQEGQELCIRRAYEQTRVSPATIGLLEAHGTGTPLGDLTEVKSITACFGERVNETPHIAMGTVKSQISHLIPASGAVSLIKTAMALYHRVLPPTLHVENVRPELGLDDSPFYLCSDVRPWIHADRSVPRRAAVNAFGFGGINAHAILEENTAVDERTLPRMERQWPVELVIVAADDRVSLGSRAASLARWVENAPDPTLLDIAASCARRSGDCRVALIASSKADLVRKLDHVARRLAEPDRSKIQDRSGIFWYDQPLGGTGKLAFVFPGEGAQYVNMLADLCRYFPEVRREFDLTDAAFAQVRPGERLSSKIFPLPGQERNAEAELLDMGGAVDAVTTANRALSLLFDRLGIRPDAVVGHSNGEFAALVAAGAIDVRDDDELMQCVADGVRNTDKLLYSNVVPRAVLTVVGGVERTTIDRIVAESNGHIRVAMDNCPNQVVLSSDEETAGILAAQLAGTGGLCQRLPWGRAYHTDLFRPAAEIFNEYYGKLRFKQPDVELWSCMTAGRYPREPQQAREYAVGQWHHPVRFRETILAMHKSGIRLFVELGPKGNLASFIEDTLAGTPHVAVPANVMRKSGIEQLCRAVGMLVAHGREVKLDELYSSREPNFYDLDAPPPPAEKRDPLLRLDLPEMKLGDELVAKLKTTRHTDERIGVTPSSALAAPTSPATAAETPIASASQRVASDTPGNAVRVRAFADYQQTMRQFLELQQRVMTGAHTPPAHDPPVAQPVAEQDIDRPSNGHVASTNGALAAAPTTTGGVTSELTGSDSNPPNGHGDVKIVEPVAADLPDTGLEKRLLEIVSERTGYPVDMLSLNAQMEADLGIDSIKRVEIVGSLRREVFPSLDEPPDWFMERMTAAGSLAEILSGVDELRSKTAPTAEGPGGGMAAVSDGAPAAPLGSALAARFPLLEKILVHEPETRLVAEVELDVQKHPFLRDHTFGRGISLRDPALLALPVMPAAMTAELIAEAAAMLEPSREVAAVTNFRAFRWVAQPNVSRRLRVEALREPSGKIHVKVHEADREPSGALVAEGTVEIQSTLQPLGTSKLTSGGSRPSRWPAGRIYEGGGFHGPSFQAIVSMDGYDKNTAGATLAEPADPLFEPTNGDCSPVLPVALIDGLGTARGLWFAEEKLKPIFPVGFDRLEFQRPTPGGKLTTVLRKRRQEGMALLYDCEASASDGQVALRILGAQDQAVDLPEHFWHYRAAPESVVFARRLNDLFAHVPRVDQVTLAGLTDFAGPLLAENSAFWSLVLSRLVLSSRERQVYDRLKRPPEAAVSWLLGRMVAKDAVRLHQSHPLCMADVEVTSDEKGRPEIDLGGPEGPLVSLAYRGYQAVAAAADAGECAGVGIDIEPRGPMPPELIEDSFDVAERALLANAATASGEPLDDWLLAAWGAKEATGKALGSGVLGGPRSIRIAAIDAAKGRLSTQLAGPMAKAFPQFSGTAGGQNIDTFYRTADSAIITLCLLWKN